MTYFRDLGQIDINSCRPAYKSTSVIIISFYKNIKFISFNKKNKEKYVN